jgi:hypothetical protein
MEGIRILNKRHYDRRLHRFTSVAFKNTGGDNPGISIIKSECIRRSGRTICNHIRLFYGTVASTPPIFWCFSTEILPAGYQLEQEDSPIGDDCHYNIKGLPDKQAKRLFKPYAGDLNNFSICENGTFRPLTRQDVEE